MRGVHESQVVSMKLWRSLILLGGLLAKNYDRNYAFFLRLKIAKNHYFGQRSFSEILTGEHTVFL